MFRISQYMRELAHAEQTGHYPEVRERKARGPVVIWNLIRRCNLTCKHCYALSADHDYVGELTLPEVFTVMDDLKGFGVPALILSGGEPLLRPDIFEIFAQARKLGLRFTMTAMNAHDLPNLLQLMKDEGANKFYFSHLNYAGRGNIHRDKDAHHLATRDAMNLLFDRAWADAQAGCMDDYVSGNNDADGPFLLHWVRQHLPHWESALTERLTRWGGNASGQMVANIDNLGHVHPDTMWWHHDLGCVRDRPFSAIWNDTSDPLMAGLKQHPRPVQGRCAGCKYLAICNGNTRVRAQQLTGNPWFEDPGCYLTDDEVGAASTPLEVPAKTKAFNSIRRSKEAENA